jgi:hypothetical protein
MEKMKNGYKTSARKPEGVKSHGRLRPRWENNIKMGSYISRKGCIHILVLYSAYSLIELFLRT